MTANAVMVSVLLSGCTTTHTVATLHPHSASDHATGELADGGTIEIHATETPDGLRWQADKTGAPVDSATLRSYTTVSYVRGGGSGLLIGGFGGGAVGAASGWLISGGRNSLISRTDGAAIYGVLLGGLCGIVGLVSGLTSGDHDVYRLESSHAPQISPTIAPGAAGAMASWSF